LKCLPRDFARELRDWKKPLHEGCEEFHIGPKTYVWITTTFEKCGVLPATVYDWIRKKRIDEPLLRYVWVQDGGRGGRRPPQGGLRRERRAFVWKQQIDAVNEPRATPKQARPKPRTPTEIWSLADDDYITPEEMEGVGVKWNHAKKHWDFKNSWQKGPRTPDPLIGRLFKTKPVDAVDAIGAINRRPLIRWKDIRDHLTIRDKPPPGGVWLQDALPRLRAIGIVTNESNLRYLIKRGVIVGGVIRRAFGRKGPSRTWIKEEDHEKIRPRFPRAGNRLCWLDGEDWHPVLEARRLAGCNSFDMRQWMPRVFGGYGRLCPHLPGGRSIRCRPGPIPHKKGDKMTVCAGDDLRTIAEKLTGVRPKAPPKPPEVKRGAAPLAHSPPPAAAIPAVGPQPATGEGQTSERPTKRRRGQRGRSPDTDPAFDQRISEAWDTGEYPTYAALGRDFDKGPDDIRRAIDRHRHPRKSAGK
jgi:hypothetical protein